MSKLTYGEFTFAELDDLDSAIGDSMTLTEEVSRGKPSTEENAYLARLYALRLTIDGMMNTLNAINAASK